MDNYIETIKQLQLTIQLAYDENKELSQQLLSYQNKQDPEADLQITNLQKTVLLQQQQIAQLKQEFIKQNRVQHIDDEQQYQIQQLNTLINDKEAELNKLDDLIYQIQSQIKNTQQELQELKDIQKQKQKEQIQINKKAELMEKLMHDISGQDSLSISYVNEIDKLNNKLQSLEKLTNVQSRLTYQSYYKYN